MGDIIDLQARIALVLETLSPDHDAQLLNEGLELLADFRSIEDRMVRASIRQMVSDVAAAFRRS
ncbi:protein of unknown function [Beijerinckiaceae bacterium RH AL1]|nr:hypothetical protein [Beijerinckiaceae bacterium]VVB47891.1 protein of unknown function [Beijerinckiaceae bacterium RH CH11]VVB47968.1 protein of unknown function [Beijerinckiaceae bacterium RH AL8]VVC56117.1 protein of unknown function [Beijerinckiaceae bacterium RH AL1]